MNSPEITQSQLRQAGEWLAVLDAALDRFESAPHREAMELATEMAFPTARQCHPFFLELATGCHAAALAAAEKALEPFVADAAHRRMLAAACDRPAMLRPYFAMPLCPANSLYLIQGARRLFAELCGLAPRQPRKSFPTHAHLR